MKRRPRGDTRATLADVLAAFEREAVAPEHVRRCLRCGTWFQTRCEAEGLCALCASPLRAA